MALEVSTRRLLSLFAFLAAAVLLGASSAGLGVCGPFFPAFDGGDIWVPNNFSNCAVLISGSAEV